MTKVQLQQVQRWYFWLSDRSTSLYSAKAYHILEFCFVSPYSNHIGTRKRNFQQFILPSRGSRNCLFTGQIPNHLGRNEWRCTSHVASWPVGRNRTAWTWEIKTTPQEVSCTIALFVILPHTPKKILLIMSIAKTQDGLWKTLWEAMKNFYGKKVHRL